MNIGKLSYYSRKVHQWSLWFVVGLGCVQTFTGLTLKYPSWFSFIDQERVRLLHVQTAGYFALAFGIQMLTGLSMYFTPWLIKRQQKSRIPDAA